MFLPKAFLKRLKIFVKDFEKKRFCFGMRQHRVSVIMRRAILAETTVQVDRVNTAGHRLTKTSRTMVMHLSDRFTQ